MWGSELRLADGLSGRWLLLDDLLTGLELVLEYLRLTGWRRPAYELLTRLQLLLVDDLWRPLLERRLTSLLGSELRLRLTGDLQGLRGVLYLCDAMLRGRVLELRLDGQGADRAGRLGVDRWSLRKGTWRQQTRT